MRFKDLKPGDQVLRFRSVIAYEGSWCPDVSVRVCFAETVAKVTATQGTLTTGERFKRDSGRIIGRGADANATLYPVGWTGSSSCSKPLEPTPQEAVDRFEAIAKQTRHLLTAIKRFQDNEREIIRTVVSGNTWSDNALQQLEEATASVMGLLAMGKAK